MLLEATPLRYPAFIPVDTGRARAYEVSLKLLGPPTDEDVAGLGGHTRNFEGVSN